MSKKDNNEVKESTNTIYESDYDLLNSAYSDAPYSKLPSTVQNNNYGTSLANPDIED